MLAIVDGHKFWPNFLAIYKVSGCGGSLPPKITLVIMQRHRYPLYMNAPLIDPFARAITYLRLSVTDRCDFRCVYCMSENMTFLPKRDLLTLEELDRLCTSFIGLGVRKLRITGGEPLVRRDIM